MISAAKPSGKTSSKPYVKVKRILDLIVAGTLLILLAPVLLLIAVAVKTTSAGPVLYRQERIGKDGRPFYMLKFRSMRVSEESITHRDHVQRLIRENTKPSDLGATSLKLQGDSRITPLGKVIRKLSLDELPQFINVLRGEMSLVGPRPPVPYEYELYSSRHKERLAILPGITGLWQVTGRNQVSFEEMVQIDLEYIATMGLGVDLSIMLRTPIEMLRGKGGG